MTRHAAALFAFVAAVCLFPPAPAHAHLGSVTFIDVTPDEGGVRFTIDIERVDAAMELLLSEDATEEAIRVRLRAVERWVQEGITFRSSAPCTTEFGSVSFVDRELGRYLRFEGRAECPDGEITLRDDTVFDDDAQHETLVRVIQGGESTARVLRGGSRETAIAGLGGGALFMEFLWQGGLHFALGFDHILFLLTLVLGVALGWNATRKVALGMALRSLAWLVTAFTLGHSITLITAALGLVVLPARPVEVAIAASIAIVAIWNLTPFSKSHTRPWAAFVFGLVHGFGFSSVLADLGLPTSSRAIALTAFNVGIEIAQLAFVALLFGPLVWMASRKSYPRVAAVLSVAVLVCALYWVVDRI